MMDFERGFNDTERAADAVLASAGDLARLARQLQKASREGNIGTLKKAREKLGDALDSLSQTVANAAQSWPFEDGEEERYLRNGYADELRRIASESGLKIHERDARLVSHPSILRILPSDRAVRIDRKKVSALRPSYLAALLLENQKKGGRYESAVFVEALYNVYAEMVRDDARDRLIRGGGVGTVVPLDRIYRLFTSLPGSGREYDRTDFARDLYLLDTNGPRSTRKGAVVSFPSSTGTRGSKVFTFVGPDGDDVSYYGIQFTQG